MKRLILIAPLLYCVACMAGPDSSIARFNQALTDATQKMDNAALIALWDDDGISLLPNTKPLIGKSAIAAMINGVTAQFPDAKMKHFEMHCFNIDVSGDWATEWCTEHQIVDTAPGKAPFDGRGNMLLVLKKNANGVWHLKREMWNQAAAE